MSNFISGNILYASDLNNEFAKKQDNLISGTNIKTVNGNSILGSGNLKIDIPDPVTVDTALSATSTNPVQNKVITNALNDKQEFIGRINAQEMLLTLIAISHITNVNSISSGDMGDLTVRAENALLDLQGTDVTVTAGNYNMSYDTTKEAIVWTFK